MNNSDVSSILSECDTDISDAKAIVDSLGFASTVVPYLNKYCIIRACGAIELSFKSLVADFCSVECEGKAKNFIDKYIRKSSANPSYMNICGLLKQFDLEWNRSFKSAVKSHEDCDEIKDALASLVEARNQFAHGGNPGSSISDVINYFNEGKKMILILDEIIG